jgi:hypothetical protein
VVGRFVPLQTTDDPATKFDPVTVSVNAALPATAVVGVIPVRVGGLTVKEIAFDVPDGFCTVTTVCPGVASRLAGTTTLIAVGLPIVAGSVVPPQFTVAPVVKLDPVMFTCRPEVPAGVEGGASALIAATAPPIENVTAFDVDPPGFATVTNAIPGFVRKDAGTSAFN